MLQVVQEYERAVIFRLGRLRKGGAKVERKQFPSIFYITSLLVAPRRAPASSL